MSVYHGSTVPAVEHAYPGGFDGRGNTLWIMRVECHDGWHRVSVLAPGYAAAHKLLWNHPYVFGLPGHVLDISPDWAAIGEVRP